MPRALVLAVVAHFFATLGGWIGADAAALTKHTSTWSTLRAGLAYGLPRSSAKHLRVCNAYAYPAAMFVRQGKSDITVGSPMPYKACRDFLLDLRVSDSIEFAIGITVAGTFLVKEVPAEDAILLLVIKRHDTHSTAAAFDSHVFSSSGVAQVAVIDAYQGAAWSLPRIGESDSHGGTRTESLHYDTVVAIDPGIYHMTLIADGGGSAEAKAESDLVALRHESYVVMRTGVEGKEGPSYNEELVVYPRSSVLSLTGAAAGIKQPHALTRFAVTIVAAISLYNV
mmetsp:Transcript_84823/g.274148  ORF Transcript_84823/g.274148 Transcript_84823/m.274148 type:complete len:283 (+) Transcript_84823:186-1034(+)